MPTLDYSRFLKYEELIADTPAVVRRLCAFLEEPFEEAMLAYHHSREAQTSGSLSISWQNTARPVMADNAQKFRTRLTGEEIRLFEAIAGAELQELGYPLVTPPERLQSSQEGEPERLSYRVTESFLKLKAEVHHLLRDKNSVTRLRKNIYLAALHIRRRP